MRPLHHPAIADVTVAGILHALSEPDRVSIYAAIAGASCAMTCTDASSSNELSIPKSTLSQHFKILREAGLIRSERKGVELLNTSRCKEIEARFPGLLPAILDAHVREQNAARGAARARARRASKSP